MQLRTSVISRFGFGSVESLLSSESLSAHKQSKYQGVREFHMHAGP